MIYIKYLVKLFFEILWKIQVYYFKPRCDICFNKKYTIRNVYKRLFLECDVCNLVVCRDLPYFIQDIGMGRYGMIEGEPSGGFFDHYLSKYASTNFNSEQIVIFGAGVTLAPIQLKLLNISVSICDVSKQTRNYWHKKGFKTFNSLNSNLNADAIIVCEVIEHFNKPRLQIINLLESVGKDGVICGTSDFYNGSEIYEGENKIGYMSWKGHNTYWNQKSLRYLLDDTEYELFTFKVICPGEFVKCPLDDELHPNKTFFFITKNKKYMEFLNAEKEKNKTLPFDSRVYESENYIR